MKRKTKLLFVGILAIMMSTSFISCDQAYGGGLLGGNGGGEVDSLADFEYELASGELDGAPCVSITVTSVAKKTMLTEVMEKAKQNGDFTFEMSDGMITSINGLANPADWSKCWMLFTSDAEMSNTAWGTITWNGATYGSAVVGADALDVVAGETYVWYYQSF
jgi:hypothetical protein